MFQFTCPVVATQPIVVRCCKLCNSGNVVINQTLTKAIKDSVESEVTVLRLRCKTCKYSWRCYPEGVRDYSSRTKRVVFLGLMLYAAGLSYEKSAGFLNGMTGRKLEGFVTIWRDVQVLGEKLRRNTMSSVHGTKTGQVVVGIDGTYVKVKGKEQPILLATNTTNGTTIMVSLGSEWQEKELKQFLKEVAKALRIPLKAIAGFVTDDLATYKPAIATLKKPHQVCLAHVKKNLAKRLKKLEKKLPRAYLEKLAGILDPPTKDADTTILQALLKDEKLWRKGKRYKQWVAYRELVGDLLRNWSNYTAHLQHPQVPFPLTNNRTEQAIGRSKIRYKTTRGFKSQQGVHNFFTLTQTVGMHQNQKIASLC